MSAGTELHDIYINHKNELENRLDDFRSRWAEGSDQDIFEELCYCLCTAREKAKYAFAAMGSLRKTKKLFKGSEAEIDAVLLESGIALHPAKAQRIIQNREIYYPGTKKKIEKEFLCFNDILLSRRELKNRINGFGFKEASHFLRNLGFGEKICILDTHTAQQLVQYKVISERPSSWTEKKYLEVERAMIGFAKKVKIPVDALDLVFMLKENPEIIK
ncbi:probable N-glycosylase/DNA lyase [Treponema primitia ZAS-2]|uniref:8-oxoguanine DNA glycosylase/AP lyase n=1 Tax=Treponema primitia (strain ATCC BAA-887 / DSM 12427 / ZAS-2) TaxID=545694 RepID=F5YGR9_TREPZ|nr:N-glycosylase/DNA lyase [Treponema primitia]AEF86378.1 probable N-glycosylase/DNA lyase [Treponema primitia ZAS-2]